MENKGKVYVIKFFNQKVNRIQPGSRARAFNNRDQAEDWINYMSKTNSTEFYIIVDQEYINVLKRSKNNQ